jgi:hypothetical protein
MVCDEATSLAGKLFHVAEKLAVLRAMARPVAVYKGCGA